MGGEVEGGAGRHLSRKVERMRCGSGMRFRDQHEDACRLDTLMWLADVNHKRQSGGGGRVASEAERSNTSRCALNIHAMLLIIDAADIQLSFAWLRVSVHRCSPLQCWALKSGPCHECTYPCMLHSVCILVHLVWYLLPLYPALAVGAPCTDVIG